MKNDEPLLFTPGPLTTSPSVKQAMLRDLGSRDQQFLDIVADIRTKLLGLAGTSQANGYEAILMQGSGTFGIEATIGTLVGPNDELLVIINGAYGRRMKTIAEAKGLNVTGLEFDDRKIPDLEQLSSTLNSKPFTHVAVVHCETTTGIMNPIEAIGKLVRSRGMTYIVDAMSSFGAVPTDVEATKIDFLVSSANKCIQGVPGFSFVIANQKKLDACSHDSTSVSLDLRAQLRGLNSNGQFRFTPPTHVLLAFYQALLELEEEGGVTGRASRYRGNHGIVLAGMKKLGFEATIEPEFQSYIITSFNYPSDKTFDFTAFYKSLAQSGHVIYPGKLSDADCFRIGNIGHLFKADMESLLAAVENSCKELGLELAKQNAKGFEAEGSVSR